MCQNIEYNVFKKFFAGLVLAATRDASLAPDLGGIRDLATAGLVLIPVNQSLVQDPTNLGPVQPTGNPNLDPRAAPR